MAKLSAESVEEAGLDGGCSNVFTAHQIACGLWLWTSTVDSQNDVNFDSNRLRWDWNWSRRAANVLVERKRRYLLSSARVFRLVARHSSDGRVLTRFNLEAHVCWATKVALYYSNRTQQGHRPVVQRPMLTTGGQRQTHRCQCRANYGLDGGWVTRRTLTAIHSSSPRWRTHGQRATVGRSSSISHADCLGWWTDRACVLGGVLAN